MTNERGDNDNPAHATNQPQGALKARQRVIGAGLKRLYQDVLEEGIPDDFNSLLAQFEGGAKPSTSEGGNER